MIDFEYKIHKINPSAKTDLKQNKNKNESFSSAQKDDKELNFAELIAQSRKNIIADEKESTNFTFASEKIETEIKTIMKFIKQIFYRLYRKKEQQYKATLILKAFENLAVTDLKAGYQNIKFLFTDSDKEIAFIEQLYKELLLELESWANSLYQNLPAVKEKKEIDTSSVKGLIKYSFIKQVKDALARI